jgi:hypothetical protein
MAQALTHGGQGGVDNRIAEQAALSLQRLNRVLEIAYLLHGSNWAHKVN